MHIVSSDGAAGAAQQALLMPMLTRMPKQRVKMLVVSLAPNAVPGAVLRQNGVPVYDVALSKQRFSISAFAQLLKTVRAYRPDVIQGWGHTAQIVSHWLRGRCEWEVKTVWAVTNTTPLPRKAGMVDRQKLKYAAKFSKHADRIVYTSEAAASAHRRAGFPEEGHAVVPLGLDPTRFKPDLAARRKVRDQLGLAPESFVIGMMAPFQPEYDHSTLFKAVGELIKTDPNVCVLLAGHGVQKGNGPLMALVGGGTLGTRTQLLGEWSDTASFFNACDLACSSALTDTGRMSLVMAMLCGVPCVATGMGAQGEVIGQHGVAVEPGSAVALIRGITRVMQLPQDKRVYMAQGARKHALNNFVSIRSLQKYLQLYCDLLGRTMTATTAVPAPEIDATIPQPKPEDQDAVAKPKPKANRSVDMSELSDPDSLESRDTPNLASVPNTPSSPSTQAPEVKASEGDVLQLFESSMAKQASTNTSPMSERARGVADELGDLLSPDLLNGTTASDTKPAAADAPPPEVVDEAPKASALVAKQASATSADALMPPSDQVAIEKPALTPAAAKVERAQTPESAKVEFSISDTIVSMKISMDATGTLEIPPELIFTPARAVVKAVTKQPEAIKPADTPAIVATTPIAELDPKPVAAVESTAAPIALDSKPVAAVEPVATVEIAAVLVAEPDAKPIAAVENAAAPDTIIADSATVPALAVDALLSNPDISLTIVEVSPQLDLLGDSEPIETKLVMGDRT
jgi:glycosyltransferase involved in cell wall biosynthesis